MARPDDDENFDWFDPDRPTVADGAPVDAGPAPAEPVTAPHDMTRMAEKLRTELSDDRVRTIYTEGQEDVIRRLYVVMREHGLTRSEMDNIVLDVREGLTPL